jgi:hypothetical protein
LSGFSSAFPFFDRHRSFGFIVTLRIIVLGIVGRLVVLVFGIIISCFVISTFIILSIIRIICLV